MALRHNIAYSALLVGLTATVFFFIQENDELAIDAMFFGVYAFISVLYFMKALYYARYKATLNEVYFFFLANLIPLGIFFVEPYIPLGNFKLVQITISSSQMSDMIVAISFVSLLAFPFLAVSSALLIRSFTHYEFLRITAQSSRGPSAEWTAIFAYFLFGSLLIFVGIISLDLLGILYGIFYLFSGIGFLLGK